MTIACDAVLNSPSAYKKQEPESWEEEIQVSRHAKSLRQQANDVRIQPRWAAPHNSHDAYLEAIDITVKSQSSPPVGWTYCSL